MPRFFFDIEDGARGIDHTGVEFADHDTARQYAIGIASTVFGHTTANKDSNPQRVTIKDNQGKVVDKITSGLD